MSRIFLGKIIEKNLTLSNGYLENEVGGGLKVRKGVASGALPPLFRLLLFYGLYLSIRLFYE